MERNACLQTALHLIKYHKYNSVDKCLCNMNDKMSLQYESHRLYYKMDVSHNTEFNVLKLYLKAPKDQYL